MTAQGWLRIVLAAGLLAVASPTAAQQTISSNDIQRLQDQVYQASSEVSRMRSSDPTAASRIEGELDELRDEVAYLKVKLRKEGNVSRTEYADLRDRLQDVRSRARGDAGLAGNGQFGRQDDRQRNGASSGTLGGGVSGGTLGSSGSGGSTSRAGDAPAGSTAGGTQSGGVYDDRRSTSSSGQQSGNRSIIPVGQEIDVRLQAQISSDTAQVEDRFEATTAVDLYRGNEVLIPAGSTMRGVISSVNRASRTDRKGSLTVAFDQVTVNGRSYPLRGTVTEALESEGIRGEAGRIGAGSAVGAIIGGIMGGVKGALLGVLIGGGGTIAATEGKDVTLPAGTVLRVRLDSPPDITPRGR